MDAIVELFVAIIGAILRLCIQLVAALLGAGIMASRRRGLARAGYILIALAPTLAWLFVGRFISAIAAPGH